MFGFPYHMMTSSDSGGNSFGFQATTRPDRRMQLSFLLDSPSSPASSFPDHEQQTDEKDGTLLQQRKEYPLYREKTDNYKAQHEPQHPQHNGFTLQQKSDQPQTVRQTTTIRREEEFVTTTTRRTKTTMTRSTPRLQDEDGGSSSSTTTLCCTCEREDGKDSSDYFYMCFACSRNRQQPQQQMHTECIQPSKQQAQPQQQPEGEKNSEAASSASSRQRNRLNPEQRTILEGFFKTNPLPSAKEKEYLAQELRLTVLQVHHWFHNRRFRSKRSNSTEGQAPASRKKAIKAK